MGSMLPYTAAPWILWLIITEKISTFCWHRHRRRSTRGSKKMPWHRGVRLPDGQAFAAACEWGGWDFFGVVCLYLWANYNNSLT